jgi:AcrR family transcriptional regulator
VPDDPESVSTDERILRAFLALVAQPGLAGTTTRAIAQAAGVNEVTIFRRFGSKLALAREALRRFSPRSRKSSRRSTPRPRRPPAAVWSESCA